MVERKADTSGRHGKETRPGRGKGKRQEYNPQQVVWEILNRQTRLQTLRSVRRPSEEYEEYERERREVNGLIEDLYIRESQTTREKPLFDRPGDMITQPLHSFPSPYIISALSPEQYEQFRSQARTQESPIGQSIERTSGESRSLDTVENRFGKSLLEARKRAKFDQAELARRAGTTPQYISNMETGSVPPPRRDIAVQLAEGLGISDKADRLVFLLSAQVASLEDVKGLRIVVPDTTSPPNTDTDKPQSPQPATSNRRARSSRKK